MILVVAEKPSVGLSLAKVLGATTRKDGYLEGNNYIVSWCVGHLVGLADASSYDERFAKWRYGDLPIVPEEWLFEVPKDKQKQFKVLCELSDFSIDTNAKRFLNDRLILCAKQDFTLSCYKYIYESGVFDRL